jgi:HSP20 family protein
MALIRWQPFQEMTALQRDMNRLFDSLSSTRDEDMMRMQQMSFSPAAEMEETENAINLKIEIPGMEAKDLDVQVTKEAVMISGERKSESKSEQNGMTRSEFRYGRFSRTIPLPTRVDNTNVKGDYKDGILKLEIPKAEEEKNKVTKVNIGSGNNS